MHPFSTPWKNVFRGQRKGAPGTNGLMRDQTSLNRNIVSAPLFDKPSDKDTFKWQQRYSNPQRLSL